MESDIFIYDKEMAQFDIVSAKRYLKHPVYHSGKCCTLRVYPFSRKLNFVLPNLMSRKKKKLEESFGKFSKFV